MYYRTAVSNGFALYKFSVLLLVGWGERFNEGPAFSSTSYLRPPPLPPRLAHHLPIPPYFLFSHVRPHKTSLVVGQVRTNTSLPVYVHRDGETEQTIHNHPIIILLTMPPGARQPTHHHSSARTEWRKTASHRDAGIGCLETGREPAMPVPPVPR